MLFLKLDRIRFENNSGGKLKFDEIEISLNYNKMNNMGIRKTRIKVPLSWENDPFWATSNKKLDNDFI